MISFQLERYQNYRNSNIEWLGEVPKHWLVNKLKRISKVKRGASPRPIDDPIYFDDENGKYGWVRIEDVTRSKKYLLSTKEKLSELGSSKSVKRKSGDLFLSIAGSVGKPIISKIDCCIHDGFVYFVDMKQENEYLYYLFNCTNIFAGLGKIGTQLNLNTEIVGGIEIPIPPLEEQQAIADYLDAKTAQIDRKIELLEAKAEKYADLKQALINETITHGLNKTVQMKESGLKWVAKIPAHWEIKRAKDLFKKMSRSAFETDGIITAFRDGQVTLRENRRTSGFTNAIFEHGYQGIRTGDLVIHAMDGFAGAIGVSDSDGKSSPVYQAYMPVDSKRVHNPYYGLLVREMALSGFVSSLGKGIRERSSEFRHKEFAPLELPVPPFEEQKAIADYLKAKTTHIEKILETIHLEIEKLKELRKTLINDVVTGKIKVTGRP